MLSTFRQDLRQALRTLRRAPAFTLTVLATLALGIGVNVAVFSVVNGVLLRELPFRDADRIIQLSNGDGPTTLSEPEVVDLRRDATSLASVGTYSFATANLTGGGIEAEQVHLARVDAGFFATLQPTFLMGRGFVPDEDAANAADVIVISHGLWQRRFYEDSAAVGRTLVVNGTPRTVVGVTRPEFMFPSPAVAIWTPLRLDRAAMVTRNNHYLATIARLAPEASVGSAGTELRTMRDRWALEYPETYNPSRPLQVDVRPIRERIVGRSQPYLVALFGAVGFVLLIACVDQAAKAIAFRRPSHARRGAGRTRRIRWVAAAMGVLAVLLIGALQAPLHRLVETTRPALPAAPQATPSLDLPVVPAGVLPAAVATPPETRSASPAPA
jgi:hypothetical protein